MESITFADVVHQSISFSPDKSWERIVLDLVDSNWVQRLRDLSQTANTRLVYMFSEHSRFGHCLGVAYLANLLMDKLSSNYPDQVNKYRLAVNAAAMLHDIGHLAPGSHTAFRTWFPGQPDSHEELATRIIAEDHGLSSILARASKDLPQLVVQILTESDRLPPWTWEIISGGGWNVDRGNWCIVDSILAGVNYGKYNIPALLESILITENHHLAVRENRLDALMHFAVSRQALYRQMYQHRVILAADALTAAVVKRARDLGDKLDFCDPTMSQALGVKTADELELETVFWMREYWWRYHLTAWSKSKDATLSDLASRLLYRRLFKTVRVNLDESGAELFDRARSSVEQAGFDPNYYLHTITPSDAQLGDFQQSMLVQLDSGNLVSLPKADPMFKALVSERETKYTWLALPKEAKELLGRKR